MSNRDNSYSQITKRLRSKYNASFFQNNSSGQVNLIDSPTGDASNPWLNSLVTGRKNVINTSDLGERKVDTSCVCTAPAPAAAPVLIPTISPAMMLPGSLYAAIINGRLFKAATAPSLSKDWYSLAYAEISWSPYMMYRGANYTYMIFFSSPISTATGGSYIVAIDSNDINKESIYYEDSFIIGLTEISSSLYVSRYLNTTPGSFIDIYDSNDLTATPFTININTVLSTEPTVIASILMGTVILNSGTYYTFVRGITGYSLTGEIEYNIYLLSGSQSNLSDLSVISTIFSGVKTPADANMNTFRRYQCTPAIHDDGSDNYVIIAENLNDGNTYNGEICLIKYNIGTSVSGIVKLSPVINEYAISSVVLSAYLYYAVGYTTSYIVGIDLTLTNKLTNNSPSSLIYVNDYSFCTDGAGNIYRWESIPFSNNTFIAKYAATADLSEPIARGTEIGYVDGSPFDLGILSFTSGRLYASFGGDFIVEINTSDCETIESNKVFIQ